MDVPAGLRLPPEGPDALWGLLPTINLQVFEAALVACAEAAGAGPQRRIVLVLDRAGGHISRQLHVPEGVHLVWLPPYSPEFQPAERLWPLTVAAHQRTAGQSLVR